MDRYTVLFLLVTSLLVLSVHAEDDAEVVGDGEADGRTLGLLKKYHNRYAYSPQPLLGGGLLSSIFGGLGSGLYGGSPYNNPYYGQGFNQGYGSPFIGGRPVNPGGFYRPGGYPPGYGGYQTYPGGYGGGFF